MNDTPKGEGMLTIRFKYVVRVRVGYVRTPDTPHPEAKTVVLCLTPIARYSTPGGQNRGAAIGCNPPAYEIELIYIPQTAAVTG